MLGGRWRRRPPRGPWPSPPPTAAPLPPLTLLRLPTKMAAVPAQGRRVPPPPTPRGDVGASATPTAASSRRPIPSSGRGDVGGTLEPIRRSPVLAARASAAAAAEEDEEEPHVPGVWDLRLASPAKINLYLRVMRRRDDGFHELESLFQAVSLHDTLRFRIKRREGGGDASAGAADVLDRGSGPAAPAAADNADAPTVAGAASSGVVDVSVGDGSAEPASLPARTPPSSSAAAPSAAAASADGGGSGTGQEDDGDDADVDTLECSTPGVPTDGSNLVLRALAAFRAATGSTTHYHVHLAKAIPHEAGLGGGSSNAATALWAANHLAGRPLSARALADIGAGLGSDVAFFFSPGTALCSGRGEAFTPVPRLPPAALYIVKPPVGLSTPAVFRALDLDGVSDADPDALLAALRSSLYGAPVVNDLEAPSFALAPELADLKALLVGCGFKRVLMSGSGSSFYCLGEPAQVGGLERALRAADLTDVRVLRAMFINRRAATVEGGPPGGDWYMDGEVEPLRPLRYNPTSLVG